MLGAGIPSFVFLPLLALLARPFLDPRRERVKQRAVLLTSRVGLLSLPDVIVVCKVAIKVGLELLVADEAHTAVAALELYSLVDLGDGDDVELLQDRRTTLDHLHVQQVGAAGLRVVVLAEGLVELGVEVAVDLVLSLEDVVGCLRMVRTK